MKNFLTKIITTIVGAVTLAVISAWIGFVAGVVWGLASRGYTYAQYLLTLL